MAIKDFRNDLKMKFPGALLESDIQVNAIPSGSLDLDYAMGTGGFPRGAMIGIFGKRDVGKSSLALSAMANAQKMGLKCGWITTEAGWSFAWARAHGIVTDDDNFVVCRATSGEQAFDQFGEFIKEGFDMVVIDSLGAMVSEKEFEANDKEAGRRVGGQSGMITDGIKRWQMSAEINNVCVLLLNQVRDDLKSTYGKMKQPGGHALEHHQAVIIELRAVGEKIKDPSDKHRQIGTEIVAVIHRTKRTEGTGMRANYMYYNAHVEGYPFAIDKASDVVAVAKKTGVIKGTTWLEFPDGHKVQGKKAAGDYILSNPQVYEQIRALVLERMVKDGGKLELRVV